MNRIAYACLALASLLAAAPAHAVTNDNGDILITAAAVNAGGITPGDAAGFPVTISVPGTYRLATNLTVTTAVNGIEVRANEVTIDMGGHTLAGSGVGRNGVASFNRALRIEHGNIRGFTNDGIRSIAQFLTVDHMTITANGRFGVAADSAAADDLAVAFASISFSQLTANGKAGIHCGYSCSAQNNIVSNNLDFGIYFYGRGGSALGNTVIGNTYIGIQFIGLGAAGNNTVMLNPWGNLVGEYRDMQPNGCTYTWTGTPPPT